MVTGLESSLWYSIATVVIALVLGGGLAMAERVWQQPVQRWFTIIMLLPVFLPPLIISTSFIATFGTNGLFPIRILYSPLAVLLAYGYYNIPLAYLLVRGALSRISPASERAAQVMGAGRWQRLSTILIPHLRATLVGAAGIIFLYSFTSFILPIQLGGVHGQTLEVWLYQQIYLYHHYTIALLAALIQFGIVTVVLLLSLRALPTTTILKTSPEQFGRTHWLFTMLHVLYASLLIVPLAGFLMRMITTSTMSDVSTVLGGHFGISLVRTFSVTVIVLLVSISVVLVGRVKVPVAIILLAVSPVTASFIWYQWFGRGYVSIIGALVLAVLPITIILIDHARQHYAHYFLKTARVLGAHWLDRLRLEWKLLHGSLRQTIVFGSILVIGDATISSALSPTAYTLAMPYTMQLIGSYRFGVGSVGLLIIMLTIVLITGLVYARRP